MTGFRARLSRIPSSSTREWLLTLILILVFFLFRQISFSRSATTGSIVREARKVLLLLGFFKHALARSRVFLCTTVLLYVLYSLLHRGVSAFLTVKTISSYWKQYESVSPSPPPSSFSSPLITLYLFPALFIALPLPMTLMCVSVHVSILTCSLLLSLLLFLFFFVWTTTTYVYRKLFFPFHNILCITKIEIIK